MRRAKKTSIAGPQIAITLRRSLIGHPGKIKKVAAGLGLKKINRTVVRQKTPQVLGMVHKLLHLLDVADVATE